MLLRVFGQVFNRTQYIFLASWVAYGFISLALLLPNRSIIMQMFSSDVVSLSTKVSFLINMYGSFQANNTLITGTYLIVVAILFGVNVAMLVYYIRRRQVLISSTKASMTNVGGMVSAIFGIGCAACGSVILTAVFGLAGTGTLLAWLPLHGLEFGLVGVLLLSISIYHLAKRINDPLVCSIKSH